MIRNIAPNTVCDASDNCSPPIIFKSKLVLNCANYGVMRRVDIFLPGSSSLLCNMLCVLLSEFADDMESSSSPVSLLQ